MPPPLQPSRASVCMGGFCARERLSVTVTVRIVLGLRLTRVNAAFEEILEASMVRDV